MDDRIGVAIEAQEGRDAPGTFLDIAAIQDAAIGVQVAAEQDILIAEAQGEHDAPEKPGDVDATVGLVARGHIFIARRVVKLLLGRVDDGVIVGQLPEVDLWLCQLQGFRGLGREILDNQLRQSALGHAVDGAHAETVAVRIDQVPVDPAALRAAQTLHVQLAYRDGHLAHAVWKLIAIHVRATEGVVGADRLDLAVGVEERLIVPEADAAHRLVVVADVRHLQHAGGGEAAPLDLGESKGVARGLDAVGYELLFGAEFIRRDAHLLHRAWEDDAAHEGDGYPRSQCHDRETHATEMEVGQHHETGDHGKHDQDVEHYQADMHIHEASAEEKPVGSEQQFIACQPVAPGLGEEDRRQQRREVDARVRGDPRLTVDEIHSPIKPVERRDGEEAEAQPHHEPAVDKAQEGKLEDVEADVAVEDRIGLVERHGVAEEEVVIPPLRRRQADGEADSNCDDQEDDGEPLPAKLC